MRHLTPDDIEQLKQRMGTKQLATRMRREADHSADFFTQFGKARFHVENIKLVIDTVGLVLRITGLIKRGNRNANVFDITMNELPVTGLPPAFDGFTILHLTDFHGDGMLDGGESLFAALATIHCDLCVLTGDYRLKTYGPSDASLEFMERLMAALTPHHRVVGVLGNHDFIETAPALERTGIELLLNEHCEINHNRDSLIVAGVDDPHYYGVHDLEAALPNHRTTPIILLAHSPGLYKEAQEAGVAAYLCGHTHGGQICLPGGVPVVTGASSPRRFVSGGWRLNSMHGYTSRGVGCAGVQARFNCPPEIVIHTLRCADTDAK